MTDSITYLQTGNSSEYTDMQGEVIAVRPYVKRGEGLFPELHVLIPKEEWDALKVVHLFCVGILKEELESQCIVIFRTAEKVAEEVIELALWCSNHDGKEGWDDVLEIMQDELTELRIELQEKVSPV